MIRVQKGLRSEDVKFQAKHTLFVEGKDRNSVDPRVLNTLLEKEIRIEPLGPSFSVNSVAQALYPHHPTYYFLIDRDHHTDAFIEKCWNNFPDPDTHNLLVWRKREIENYFLDPNYLFNSKYCKVGQDKLKRKILECAGKRLFIDAANSVITSIREELKKNWINIFKTVEDFTTKEDALQKLKTAPEFEKRASTVARNVSLDEREERFNACLEKMTGGQDKLSFGSGEWLNMIQGKKVLNQVINSGCFQVPTLDGKPLNGREKIHAVVKELTQKSPEIQPDDFVKLRELIDSRISGEI